MTRNRTLSDRCRVPYKELKEKAKTVHLKDLAAQYGVSYAAVHKMFVKQKWPYIKKHKERSAEPPVQYFNVNYYYSKETATI